MIIDYDWVLIRLLTLAESLGKCSLHSTIPAAKSMYLSGNPNLENRTMFVSSEPGGPAMRDITENRMKQYLFITNTLFESTIKISANSKNQQQFDETSKDTFKTVFEVLSLFANRLPDNTFQVNLETGEIKNLSVDK